MGKIQAPTKFTQAIKDNWLKALKSGKFIQGFVRLHTESNNSYCCIGVLGKVTPGLVVYEDSDSPQCTYNFLKNTIGNEYNEMLYSANDEKWRENKIRDYSNVIHLIEALPVQE